MLLTKICFLKYFSLFQLFPVNFSVCFHRVYNFCRPLLDLDHLSISHCCQFLFLRSFYLIQDENMNSSSIS